MSAMQWGELKDAPVNELFKGIRVRPLMEDETGIRAMLVEFDVGYCWEVFSDGVRDYPTGTYIHMPKGSAHIPQSKDGCTVFVYYPEGRPL
jgi:hypothetical protein